MNPVLTKKRKQQSFFFTIEIAEKDFEKAIQKAY